MVVVGREDSALAGRLRSNDITFTGAKVAST